MLLRTSIGTPLCTPKRANLSTSNYLSNTVRVVEIVGQPWFVAADVCRILGLSQVTNALRNIGRDENPYSD